jgi:hypothetical protein
MEPRSRLAHDTAPFSLPLILSKAATHLHRLQRREDRGGLQDKEAAIWTAFLLPTSFASVVDVLDDPALAGLDDAGPALSLDIAILTAAAKTRHRLGRGMI